MMTAILIGYTSIALLVAGATIHRVTRQRIRRDEHIDNVDRAVLVSVALLASLFWLVLFPFYLVGWLGSPEARALGTRLTSRFRRAEREPVHRVVG